MDNTMKEYEHRRLVCERECKVGEKYVLPQAQAFGLSWQSISSLEGSRDPDEQASTHPTAEAPPVLPPQQPERSGRR